jgi:hypothetical protein
MAFSSNERRALLALARAAFPAGQRAPAVDDSLAERTARFLDGAPREARFFLRAVLFALEWFALLRHGSRLSRSPEATARRYVESWAHSRFAPVRLSFRALISPLKIVHYGEPAVARALGYDPPPETACAHPRPTTLLKKPLPASGKLRCEVAVIGSGAGGATVAKELAERGRDVVLLEEGEHVETRRFNRRPLDMAALLYRDLGMTIAMGRGAGIPVPLGKVVGGTTTINSGTCLRVPAHVLERWRREGDLDLREEDLAPDYARVEEFIEVAEVPEELLGGCARAVRRGAEKLGLHEAAPRRRRARTHLLRGGRTRGVRAGLRIRDVAQRGRASPATGGAALRGSLRALRLSSAGELPRLARSGPGRAGSGFGIARRGAALRCRWKYFPLFARGKPAAHHHGLCATGGAAGRRPPVRPPQALVAGAGPLERGEV